MTTVYHAKEFLPEGVELLLASASPRRRELIAALDIPFTVRVAEVEETLTPGISPAEAVVTLAVRKARAAARAFPDRPLILAADTLVEQDGTPLGKPRDEADARRMLLSLSGREHRVHTGVAVAYRGRLLSGHAETAVWMRPFDETEADAYIRTGEPMDKAGAYGIQGLGGQFVTHIDGDFDTVVGLSLRLSDALLCEALHPAPESDDI